MTPQKIVEKGAWPGSPDSLNFWALNANCLNMLKGTEFKFGKHVSRDSPGMIPRKIVEKGAWPGSRDPLNFLGVKC